MKQLISYIAIVLISLTCQEASGRSPKKQKATGRRLASHYTPTQVSKRRAPRHRHRTYDRYVGFLTGVNFGYAKTGGPEDGATRNALAFGISLEQRIGGILFFQPELAWVQRGVKTNVVNLGDVGINGDVQLDYLEVPLLLKVKSLVGSQRLRLGFLAGPVFALTLKREVEVLGLVNVELRDRFSSTDITMALGAELEYALSKETIVSINLRHNIGLVDIDKAEDSKFYTRGFQLLMGLKFALQ